MKAELYRIEENAPGCLATMPRPRGGEWLDGEMGSLRAQGVDLLVSLLTPDEVELLDLNAEEDLATRHGIEFRSFPIADMQVPADFAPAEHLVEDLVRALRGGRTVAVHCRGGIGRSSMIGAAVLTVLGSTPDDAFDQIARRRGVAVPETDEQRSWVADFMQRRFDEPAAGWNLPRGPVPHEPDT